jgi:hypothetical protein
MSRLYFVFGEHDSHDPLHIAGVGDKANSGAAQRFSWLTLILLLAMVGSFGIIWFLSTP